MALSLNGHAKPSPLRLLEQLPGIADIVWAAVTRLEGVRVPTTVLFTSAEKRAGTSILAAATAVGLARHQRVPVTLVETNLRRPALAGYLGLQATGLSDILDGRVGLDQCLQTPEECPGLTVLTAGTPRAPVAGEFTTELLGSILAQLEKRCHYVVLDTAPVLEHVESRLLLRHADAVLLVLRARSTRREVAERAHDILVESGRLLLGSVFNDYRTEGLFGDLGSADRAFRKAVRAMRSRPKPLAPSPAEPPVLREGVTEVFAEIGANGYEVPRPPAFGSEAEYQQHIDILERRVAKLTRQLEQTEATLRRIAAMKNLDSGIASVYRTVQGLSEEEEARAYKRTLLREIFQSNLELKTAMARLP